MGCLSRPASRRIVCLLLLAGMAVGCRSQPKPMPLTHAPTTKPVEVLQRAAIDLTRGGAGFPLQTETPPQSVAELTEALRAAYVERLEGEPNIRIEAVGDSLLRLDTLNIDLTGSTVAAGFKPQAPPADAKAVPYLSVRRLRYAAEPLRYQTYAASMILEAYDVRTALIPGADKKLTLAMYDCSSGRARITIRVDELEKSLAQLAQQRASLAFGIDRVQIQLRSRTAKTLEAQLTVDARLLMLPARFRLAGRADVDENFNIHFTQLRADGDDPGGALLAAAVQARLDRLNNRAAPLLRLPGNMIRITDLRLTLDEALTIDVQFRGDALSRGHEHQ